MKKKPKWGDEGFPSGVNKTIFFVVRNGCIKNWNENLVKKADWWNSERICWIKGKTLNNGRWI
jgi:hypothetical protein